MLKRFLLVLTCALPALLGSVASCAGDTNSGQPPLDTLPISIRDQVITAEIALTYKQRTAGLSYRKSLAPDTGMLFVYNGNRTLHFTMQHASIPLSIAFIASDGTIVDIQDMEPFTEGPYSSGWPARFALEANKGWFQQHDIQPGDTVRFPATVPWKP